MTRYRILNVMVWLYLWLSDVLNPVLDRAPTEDFWLEKAKQLFRFNSNFADPAALIGFTIPLALFWFFIDVALRRRAERLRVEKPERRSNQWSDAEKEQFRRLLDEKRR